MLQCLHCIMFLIVLIFSYFSPTNGFERFAAFLERFRAFLRVEGWFVFCVCALNSYRL